MKGYLIIFDSGDEIKKFTLIEKTNILLLNHKWNLSRRTNQEKLNKGI